MKTSNLPLQYLRVIFLEWAMDPDMIYRFKSRKYKGLMLDTQQSYMYESWDRIIPGCN